MNMHTFPSLPLPIDEESNDDHNQHVHPYALNLQVFSSSSSSSSASCHIFFNSTQDHNGYYHPQVYQPHYQMKDGYYHGGSSFEMKNKASRWKKEDQGPPELSTSEKDINSIMQKMKKTDCIATKMIITSGRGKVIEDQKQQPSSSLETDYLSSNSSSYNNNSNSPIRVCADCKTTKTPLWRSGPKGPKSLCNACGIRQRKARRAMAAAVVSDHQPSARVKIKENKAGKNGLKSSSQPKKRCKMAAGDSVAASSGHKKLRFEDFLINLSNNLSSHRVFPQDEKDAAILLMALSSGLQLHS